jgi:hypothetical protein
LGCAAQWPHAARTATTTACRRPQQPTNKQVRTDLFLNIMASLAGCADPAMLGSLSALADVSSSSGMEQWVAQCANKYM